MSLLKSWFNKTQEMGLLSSRVFRLLAVVDLEGIGRRPLAEFGYLLSFIPLLKQLTSHLLPLSQL